MLEESNKTFNALSKVFEEIELSEESRDYLVRIAKTNLSIYKELLMYKSILSYINFEKIRDAIRFMSTKEIYLHYVTKSKSFSAAAAENAVSLILCRLGNLNL